MTTDDPLAACVNANFVADALDELAKYKQAIISDMMQLNASPLRWEERLRRWAKSDRAAAGQIRRLVAEVERLRRVAEVPR